MVCGDGISAPGELCFDDVVLIEGNDVTYSARLIDVDSDDDTDVVYMIGDQVVTHLGTGEGVFGPALFGVTVSPTNGEAGDIDGDGRTDLAIINVYDNTLAIALGDGVGDFTLQEPLQGTSAAPVQVMVADLDGDVDDDVLIATNTSIDVFRSDGDGTPVAGFGVGLNGPALALGLGEFDGDGDPDLIYVSDAFGNQELFIRLGAGDGTFGSSVPVEVDGATPRAVAGGDLDGDGDGDLVYVDLDLELLYVRLGNGAGGFADAVGSATDQGPQRTAVLDVTGDGDLDVVVGHAGGNSLWIYQGDGDGGLGQPLMIPLAGPVDSLGWGLANADAVPDLITTDINQHVTVVLSTP